MIIPPAQIDDRQRRLPVAETAYVETGFSIWQVDGRPTPLASLYTSIRFTYDPIS